MNTGKYISIMKRRARGSSLVRTLVVSSATLTILIVCFSIYTATQRDSRVDDRSRSTAPASARGESVPTAEEIEQVPAVATGNATIGPGQKIQMTFYPRSGSRARIELTVDSWTPVAGAANEFLLARPAVRMRTDDGHGVSVSSDRGVLEAERKTGTGLDPRRGRLSGSVVILYDRLTEAERAKLPEEARKQLDPADLVRIETDRLEFDLEYGKVLVPGQLRLTASDVEFETSELEIRFNDAQNRVEQLRINGGGRIALRGFGGGMGMSLPAIGGQEGSRVSLVEWIRATIQSKVASQEAATDVEAPVESPGEPAITETADGTPVFRLQKDEQTTDDKPPIRYYARFEGAVDVRQRDGEAVRSQLTAEVVEIVRSLSDKERDAVASSAQTTPGEGSPQGGAQTSKEQVDVVWTDRLFVEACDPQDPRCETLARSVVKASGSPAQIKFPQGHASCQDLSFEPDGSRIWLRGTVSEPAVVDFAQQGLIRGRVIYTERREDELQVTVTGPGVLTRDRLASSGDEKRSHVEFADSLEASGRYVERTRFQLSSGTLVTREHRVLDQAKFVGDVRLREEDTGLSADEVDLSFGDLVGDRQSIRRVVGDGHVVLSQGDDHVWCRHVDIELGVASSGRTVPKKATATGDVLARQGTRTIQARDQLAVDFGMFAQPVEPFDETKARRLAIASGVDPSTVDWEARRRDHARVKRMEPGVGRFRADGAVTIVDPSDDLNLTAEDVECALVDGRRIKTAVIRGVERHPATVALDTLSVTGQEVLLDVPQQKVEVPGPGRLTLLSKKDLDGQKLDAPIPIAISWKAWMKYRGEENRSVFVGEVHATSRTTTTFDCDRLQIDFVDVPRHQEAEASNWDWWVFEGLANRIAGRSDRGTRDRFSKEPASILATDQVRVLTSEFDPASGALISRSSITGPKLSVNLRSEASKLLIEGPGTLLLEDQTFQGSDAGSTDSAGGGLFGVEGESGPSNTLIEWRDSMWYDFSLGQTRFSGEVRLTYVSGDELLRRREVPGLTTQEVGPGRTTFLACEELTVDFLRGGERTGRSSDRRIGGLRSDRLKQFEAKYGVALQDSGEGLNLTAHRIVFWKDSGLLGVYGTASRKARILKKRTGQLPHQVSVKRLFYHWRTGEMEVSQPVLQVP